MKKLITLITLLVFMMSISGCATLGFGDKVADPDYAAYAQAMQVQFAATRAPLVDIAFDEEGKVIGIVVNQPVELIDIQQKKDHPGWRTATALIKGVTVVGSIMAVGGAMKDVAEASSGDTTYINSANNNSANEGTISTTSELDYSDDNSETITGEASVEYSETE